MSKHFDLVGKEAGSSASPKATGARKKAPILGDADRERHFVQPDVTRGKLQPTPLPTSTLKKTPTDTAKASNQFKYILPNLTSSTIAQPSPSGQQTFTPPTAAAPKTPASQTPIISHQANQQQQNQQQQTSNLDTLTSTYIPGSSISATATSQFFSVNTQQDPRPQVIEIPYNTTYNKQYVQNLDPNLANAVLSSANSMGHNFVHVAGRPNDAQVEDIIKALHVLRDYKGPPLTNSFSQVSNAPQPVTFQPIVLESNISPEKQVSFRDSNLQQNVENSSNPARDWATMADNMQPIVTEKKAKSSDLTGIAPTSAPPREPKQPKKPKKSKRETAETTSPIRTSSRVTKAPDRFVAVGEIDEQEVEIPENFPKKKKSKKNKNKAQL